MKRKPEKETSIKKAQPFQTEVTHLLKIVTHALYSDKSVFLRELISNASDACDRLRYLTLTQPELASNDTHYRILLSLDKDNHTLTITDNGIGMNQENLEKDLSTIARSGTSEFLQHLKDNQQTSEQNISLIGQFGVGFYSAFMVAENVDVYTCKAGETQAWHWSSQGKGTFSLSKTEQPSRGTKVVLTLKEDSKEFLEEHKLRETVKKYSDHINFPIYFKTVDSEPLNTASALWTRNKSDITKQQYTEFYHHVGHTFDEPWLTIHWTVEGIVAYRALLFIPTMKPFDLFDPQRIHSVKLYVRRVFISDKVEGLLPFYLRFLHGIVDSEDLPLNISREMLKHNTIISKIQSGLVKRVLNELTTQATNPQKVQDYIQFWENFGALLKEGLYQDQENSNQLLELTRFHSTHEDSWISLEEYVSRMKQGQESIFFITGETLEQVKKSPQLEGFRAHGIEVLIMTDPIDEFWISVVNKYKEKPFKSVTRGPTDLESIQTDPDPQKIETVKTSPSSATVNKISKLLRVFRETLSEAVKDVRESRRLIDSPVCLVADEGDMDIRLERLLRQHHHLGTTVSRRVLEINPHHSVIRKLTECLESEDTEDTKEIVREAAWLLLDQARILEGEPLTDPQLFSKRLSLFLERGTEFTVNLRPPSDDSKTI